jgi:hypothetical protein
VAQQTIEVSDHAIAAAHECAAAGNAPASAEHRIARTPTEICGDRAKASAISRAMLDPTMSSDNRASAIASCGKSRKIDRNERLLAACPSSGSALSVSSDIEGNPGL